jgi:cell division protein ZapA
VRGEMSDKKSVTVTIYGNEYTLKGDADPAYIAELAKFVDSKMGDIGKKSGAPAAKVAILAAMNIADELHRIEKSKAEVTRLFEAAEKNLLVMKTASDGSLKHSMDLKVQMDSIHTELNQMKEKLRVIQKDLDQAREAEAAAKDAAGTTQSKLDTLNLESGEMKKELESLRPQVEELKGKLDEAGKAEQELESLRKKAGETESSLADRQDELETAQATVDKLKSEFEKLLKESEKQSASFMPSEENLLAFFNKIDSVIEA